MKQEYVSMNFSPARTALLEKIDAISKEYVAQGFVLTLRQLYYQLVARNIVENTERSYKNVGNLINDGRLAGFIDWDVIEDRTRAFIDRAHWTSGGAILEAVAEQYHEDLWTGQQVRPYVLVEKEALAGVLEKVCRDLDVPLLACRGYPSVTVVREFAIKRMLPALEAEQEPLVIHLGDHDPSGIDMTRDLANRLALFVGRAVDLDRIALNYAQVAKYKLPPNPAKQTDSRFEGYAAEFGDESWELDAIEPQKLVKMVRDKVNAVKDATLMQEVKDRIESVQERLSDMARRFDDEEQG